MKKIFLIILIILGFCSCTRDESEPTGNITGNIYGVITVKETAEPIRATGVELYRSGSLLLKTVTYDDGHYEFKNLSIGKYQLKVVASGYKDVSYSVVVESNRTARADMQLERLKTYMSVRTLEATNVNGNSATLNGMYYYDSYYRANNVGFIYSTSSSPNNGGTTIPCPLAQPFSNVISNLKKGKYYFQAYAKNTYGTEYGEVLSFEISGLPSVTTLNATNVAESTATLNGRIDYEGDPTYTERGFVYSSSYPNPTVDDPSTATIKAVVSGTSKEFSANIAGLTDATSYYVRAYAISSAGAVYGEAIEFSHKDYVELRSDGIMVQKYDISSGATWEEANTLCKSSKLGGYSDWHLPTCGEAYALYENRSLLNLNTSIYYWLSEPYYSGSTYYYAFEYYTGTEYHKEKSLTLRVRCVRTLK